MQTDLRRSRPSRIMFTSITATNELLYALDEAGYIWMLEDGVWERLESPSRPRPSQYAPRVFSEDETTGNY